MSFDVRRLTAFGMVFFGLHTLTAWTLSDSASARSAFATVLPSGPGRHVETLAFVALPLLLGGALLFYGLRRKSPRCRAIGGLCGFFVFFTALVSCVIGNPSGTGLPAYLILVGFYLYVSLCDSFRIEWVAVVP